MDKTLRLALGVFLAFASVYNTALSDALSGQDELSTKEEKLEEIIVVASKNELGLEGSSKLDSVFGFEKDLLLTARSVNSYTSEFLDEFNVTDINDLVSFVPSSFTTSFFGVGGSLDIRGSSAENYFRGIKRLNNEGNFPTAVGASDRIDIVRGPMPLISGPSKVGGALNFVPKSARADTGQYLVRSTGELNLKLGEWDRYSMGVEFGGPLNFYDRQGGFFLFADLENSDSYFDHDLTRQNIFQGTLNLEISKSLRLEFGIMSQWWRGHENGGWNRVTQELIDTGTYITGQPAVDIDTDYGNGDGIISEKEIDAFELDMFESGDGGLGYTGSAPFGQSENSVTCFEGITPFCVGGVSVDKNNEHFPLETRFITQEVIDRLNGERNWLGLDPATVGATALTGNRVLIDAEDYFNTNAHILYFDLVYDSDNGVEVSNKLFIESVDYGNQNAYGFTKIGDAYVIENQFIIKKDIDASSYRGTFFLSPSIRYTNSFYALDFGDEVFDRVDLSRGFNSLSRQTSPLDQKDNESESWSHWYSTEYFQYGLSSFFNLEFEEGLDFTLGLRYDYIDIQAEDGDGELGPIVLRNFEGGERQAAGSQGAFSWSANLSQQILDIFYPYVSYSSQTSLVSAALGDVDPDLISTDSFLGDSLLAEIGVKMNAFDEKLFVTLAVFEQERQSLSLQGPTNNQATRSQGFELEARGLVADGFTVALVYSNYEISVFEEGGYTFTYLGASNLPDVESADLFGGIIGAEIYVDDWSLRGGIPKQSWGITATQKWSDRVRSSFSWTWVDETYASVVPGILLPKYNVLNLNLSYSYEQIRLALHLSNLGDERYFRGNYPSLYGNNTVLPSLPFSWLAEFSFRF
mgnify:FL=1